jgi:hypothetical protein
MKTTNFFILMDMETAFRRWRESGKRCTFGIYIQTLRSLGYRLITALVLVCAMGGVAMAGNMPKERVVNAIIGEAEGEPYQGKLAVACSIRNRGTLKGVYGEKSPRVKQHRYSPKVFVDAVRAYEESANPDNCSFIDGAQYWEGTKFPVPYWAKDMKITAVIGHQRFYKSR